MYRVYTASRLHLGLLSLPGPDVGQASSLPRADVGQASSPPWVDRVETDASPAHRRNLGGIGLMIEKPGIAVSVEPASTWSATGPLAERALAFGKQFAGSLSPAAETAFHIRIERCAPEHAGLGTGTQLGLAVARALALAVGGGQEDLPAVELAKRIGRGKRSAVGIHGFDRGGLLVDGGKGPATAIAPLVARLAFPVVWRVVVVLARGQGLYGLSEGEAFAQLQGQEERTNTLCRLVLLGMLPAAAEQDLPAFGGALYEFNRLVGELFRPFQAGTYASEQGAAVVDFVRRQGVSAVGQSSWGPAIFAVVEGDRADSLAESIRQQFTFGPSEVIVSNAANDGARKTATCGQLKR